MSQKKYFEQFGAVEIQKTFYQPASLAGIEKLRSQAPEDFEFALKAWQLITHEPSSPTYRRLSRPVPKSKKGSYGSFKPTSEVFDAWRTTSEIAEALRARIIVFQCPASFRPTSENKANMRRFFENIERRAYIFVWEPRGKWSGDEIREICEQLDLIHCVDPIKSQPVWGELKYFRLHGKTGYRYKYTDEELKELRSRIEKESDCYVMFNNTAMSDDALRFIQLLDM